MISWIIDIRIRFFSENDVIDDNRRKYLNMLMIIQKILRNQ
jgi:hypothetical protein